MGLLLKQKVQNGFAIGPQVGAMFYNATEHILDNLDVWGGHIERDGLNWTVVLDEFLDTDGTPATAGGRWKTGETDTAGTRTCQSDVIWSATDTSGFPLVALDSRALRADDTTSGDVDVYRWGIEGGGNVGVYGSFQRPQSFAHRLRYSESYTDTGGAGAQFQKVEMGGNWTAPATDDRNAFYVYTGDNSSIKQADFFAGRTWRDTTNSLDRWESFSAHARGLIAIGDRKLHGPRGLVTFPSGTDEFYAGKFEVDSGQYIRAYDYNDTAAMLHVGSSGYAYSFMSEDLPMRAPAFHDSNGAQVVGTRGASVSDAVAVSGTATTDTHNTVWGFASDTEMNDFIDAVNAIKDQFNTLKDRLEPAGHGLIA